MDKGGYVSEVQRSRVLGLPGGAPVLRRKEAGSHDRHDCFRRPASATAADVDLQELFSEQVRRRSQLRAHRPRLTVAQAGLVHLTRTPPPLLSVMALHCATTRAELRWLPVKGALRLEHGPRHLGWRLVAAVSVLGGLVGRGQTIDGLRSGCGGGKFHVDAGHVIRGSNGKRDRRGASAWTLKKLQRAGSAGHRITGEGHSSLLLTSDLRLPGIAPASRLLVCVVHRCH